MADHAPGRTKRYGAGLLASLIAASFLSIGSQRPAVAGGYPTSSAPDEQLLVVSDNVYDTERRDSRKPGDMRRFAVSSLEEVDYFPDVYLLQELRRASVKAILAKLNEIAPDDEAHYVTAVAAPRSPWKKLSNKRLLGTDVAIVVNDVTMRKLAGGHVRTSYKISQSVPGSPARDKKHAFAYLEKTNSLDEVSVRASVVSLHYPKAREFASKRISQSLKRQWTKKIADKLDQLDGAHGVADHKVIAGDANNFKCDMLEDCPELSPMYALITGAEFAYKDSVIVFEPNKNPIDYLLTTGFVAAGAEDSDPRWTSNENSPRFYSNHKLRWGLLESVDTTGPTAPIDPQVAVATGGRTPRIRVQGWKNARDGGTGVDIYQVWRQYEQDPWELVELVPLDMEPAKYVDYDVEIGETYDYKVNAIDLSTPDPNAGDFTSVVSCVVPQGDATDC